METSVLLISAALQAFDGAAKIYPGYAGCGAVIYNDETNTEVSDVLSGPEDLRLE